MDCNGLREVECYAGTKPSSFSPIMRQSQGLSPVHRERGTSQICLPSSQPRFFPYAVACRCVPMCAGLLCDQELSSSHTSRELSHLHAHGISNRTLTAHALGRNFSYVHRTLFLFLTSSLFAKRRISSMGIKSSRSSTSPSLQRTTTLWIR